MPEFAMLQKFPHARGEGADEKYDAELSTHDTDLHRLSAVLCNQTLNSNNTRQAAPPDSPQSSKASP
jgi:hypothetical protein